jgi:predicted CopG family antitoxin
MDELTKKNITLKPYIYDRLLTLKHGKDTFSDVVERLILNWEGEQRGNVSGPDSKKTR